MSQPEPYSPQPTPTPPEAAGFPTPPAGPPPAFPPAAFPPAAFPAPDASPQPAAPAAAAFPPASPAPEAFPPAAAPAAPYPADQPPAAAPAYGAPAQAAMPGQPPYGTPDQPYAPGQPYGAPGQPPQAPAKKKTGLLIVAAVVVVALIVFCVYWFALRDKNGGGGGDNPAPGQAATTAVGAVQGYLDALAAGNAADALKYASSQPADTTFLTDEVLAASLAINPITNIQVTAGANTYDGVVATYNIGTQRVSANFYPEQIGKEYLLDDAAQSVNLTYIYQAGIGMALNGVSLDGLQLSSVYLFPGTYQFTTTNSLLVFSPGQFVVEDPDGFTSTSSIQLALASDAQPKLQAAAKTALDGCLTEKTLVTSCGFGLTGSLPGGGTPDLSTLTWTVASGDATFAQTTFSAATYSSNPTSAKASVSLKITGQLNDTAGKSYSGNTYVFSVTVDFSDPANMKVTFS